MVPVVVYCYVAGVRSCEGIQEPRFGSGRICCETDFAENVCFYNVFAYFPVNGFPTLDAPNGMLDPRCNSLPPQQGNLDSPLVFQ